MNHFVWVSGQPNTFFFWTTMGQESQGVGRIKLCRPDPAWPWGQAEWAQEADSTRLNGVVEVPTPLQIISQPKSISVGIGQNALLTVVADGTDPTIHYQWQFAGTNLPGATTASLSNRVGMLTSRPAKLIVLPAVSETNNQRPVLPTHPDLTISALGALVVTNTASDPDSPANGLSYQLLNPPAGVAIDADGVIRWAPSRAQGPSTNRIVTVATDDGVPNLSATNGFMVIVSAPVLTLPASYTVNVGQAVTFTNSATDNDPARTLTFSVPAAPVGVAITPQTGILDSTLRSIWTEGSPCLNHGRTFESENAQ